MLQLVRVPVTDDWYLFYTHHKWCRFVVSGSGRLPDSDGLFWYTSKSDAGLLPSPMTDFNTLHVISIPAHSHPKHLLRKRNLKFDFLTHSTMDSAASLMSSLARPTILRPGEMTLDLCIGAMNPVMRFEVYFSSRYQVTFELNENNTASRLWVFVSTSDPCPTEETAMWSCKEPVTRKRIVIHPVDDRFVEGPCYIVVRYTGTSGNVYFSMLTSVKESFSSRWDFPASTYEGDWHLNHRHGSGKCVYYFKNGLRLPSLAAIVDASEVDDSNEEAHVLALPSYEGVFEAYSGEWRDGLKDGRGVYQWRNKSYVGQWQDGKRNGKGTFVLEDGSRYVGAWRDDKKSGYGVQHYANGTCYEGWWQDNKRSGDGCFKYANGVEISGKWADDVLASEVEAVYPATGSGPQRPTYKGDWQNDSRHGVGTFHDEAGLVFSGEWVDDKRHGRGVWHLPRGVKFEGEWEDDERLEDRGEFKFPNDDSYEGDWDSVRHLREGVGTCRFANGDHYEGEWSDDVMSGRGVMTYENGIVYDGEWEGGERHGEGVCTSDESTYTGSYVRNLRSGRGVCTYANGHMYDGEWLDDMRHGSGVLRDESSIGGGVTVYNGGFERGAMCGYGEVTLWNGEVYKGEWKNSKRHGNGFVTYADGNTFEGTFQNGSRTDGMGRMRYANGDSYEGPFRGEMRHGAEGTCTYQDGTKYSGPWESDRRHGANGSFHNQTGDVWTGEWEDDVRLDGHGVCQYADGNVYEGEWRDELPHGTGALRYPDGTTFEGQFVAGVYRL